MQDIKILVMDDDNLFYELFKECMADRVDISVSFKLDFSDKPGSHDFSNDYSIYIIDNLFDGVEMCFEIIEKIRFHDNSAKIFVATGYGDFNLIKSLWAKNIEGFIDKNNIDCSLVVDSINILNNNYKLIYKLEEKMKKVQNIKNNLKG